MNPLLRRLLSRLPLRPALAGLAAAATLAAQAAPAEPASADPAPAVRATPGPAAAGEPATGTSSSPAEGVLYPHAPSILAEGNVAPHRGTGAAPADSRIVEEINSRLAGDPRLEDADIRVEVHGGSVVLSGRSPTDEGRQAAEEVALQVEGVTQVDNRISSPSSATTIGERSREALKRTEEIASDSWITTKLRSAILADPLTRSSSGTIGIKTVDGVVTLSGTVGTQAEFERVIRIAHDIKGVKQVNSSGLQTAKTQ